MYVCISVLQLNCCIRCARMHSHAAHSTSARCLCRLYLTNNNNICLSLSQLRLCSPQPLLPLLRRYLNLNRASFTFHSINCFASCVVLYCHSRSRSTAAVTLTQERSFRGAGRFRRRRAPLPGLLSVATGMQLYEPITQVLKLLSCFDIKEHPFIYV